MKLPTDLVEFAEFSALRVEGFDDGHSFAFPGSSCVRIGYAAADANMAVVQVYTDDGGFAEALLSMQALRDMSVETGHLAHGR